MNIPTAYNPSRLLPGDTELLRQHSFTRWMSHDLLQAATDFCKNLGLFAIYSETSPDNRTRYIFWRTPQEATIEIRSGRTKDQFEKLDQANSDNGRTLLSLHINENDIYSAVWISTDCYDTATAVLAAHGITPVLKQTES